ncbi:MAG TPA: 50S ribosomal protein L11 methyltransferase [Geobacteraceae bacterium]|nr:50S ribosomal protein L11 methyltransferase [Geobacteraceae bacterium]
MIKLWAQVSWEVPDSMTDDISEFLIGFSPDGVITENLVLDTFSLESLEEPSTRTVTAFFEADDALEGKIAAVNSYLKETGPSFPGFLFKEPTLSFIKEEDWSASWKSNFKPVRVGKRLVVKPTWEEYTGKQEDIILELDPGMAFGTGTHPTTRLCMEIMESIRFREGAFSGIPGAGPFQVLDVGTGSGILAITAARLGAARVLAIDIDTRALEVAVGNINLNGVEKLVSVSDTPLAEVRGDFDVVVSNILAEDLVKMAPELVKRIRKGGFLILSGILTEKEETVLLGFSLPGMILVEIMREDEWSCLTYRLAE